MVDVVADRLLAPQLNAFRSHRCFLSNNLAVGLWPAWLSAGAELPKQLQLCGFPFADGGGCMSQTESHPQGTQLAR